MTRGAPLTVAATPNTADPIASDAAVAPGDRRGTGRVDCHDREIAVAIDTGHGAAGRAPVGERDGDLVAAQVVGIGQDLAVGDDDAGAAGVAPDADDGGAGGGGDGTDGRAEFFDDAHGMGPLR